MSDSNGRIRSIGTQSDPAMAMGWLREQLDDPDLKVASAVVAIFDGDGIIHYMTAGAISRQDVVWLGAHLQHDALVGPE